MDFYDLFDLYLEYPDETLLAERGVVQNTLYEYVSSDYLQGFVNYVKIYSAIMVERYEEFNDQMLQRTYDELSKSRHSNYYDICEDDVALFGETKNSLWFFYLDRDVSDCMIGRIEKGKVTKEEFKQLFIDTLEGKHFELPSPKGWITLS